MDERKIFKLANKIPFELMQILIEINKSINKLEAFANNINIYGGQKVYRDLVNVDNETLEEYELKERRKIDGKLIHISEDRK